MSKKETKFDGKPGKDGKRYPLPKPANVLYKNDPAWYEKNKQLADDAAKINMQTRVGQLIELNDNSNWYGMMSVPGIIACHFVPGVGYATGPDSQINVAGKQLATYVRSRASNSLSDYDYLDMIIYCLAYDSIQMYIEWCRRIYGLLSRYDPLNLYVPTTWAKIMGVDFDDLSLNAPKFRTFINRMINSVSRFTVPKRFPLFDRHKALVSGVYRDSQEEFKCQYYVWNPDYLYLMSLDEDGAGCLKPTPMPWVTDIQRRATLDELIAFGDSLIDSLYEYSYGHVISSDLQRAFGPEDMYSIPYLDENYEVPYIYDEFMLDQIENATFVGQMGLGATMNHNDSKYWVKQDESKGFLLYTPKFYYTNQAPVDGVDLSPGRSWLEGKRIVNFTTPNITSGNQIEATLYCNIPDPDTFTWNEDGGVGYEYPTMTTEVATTFDVVFMQQEVNSQGSKYPESAIIQGYTSLLPYVIDPTDSSGETISSEDYIKTMNRLIRAVTMLSAFRRHPQIAICGGTSANQTGMVPRFAPTIGPIMQTEVFGVVDREVLTAMAKVATDCMFDVANPITVSRSN